MLVIFDCEFIIYVKSVGVLWASVGAWGRSPTVSICFSISAGTVSTSDLGLLLLALNQGLQDSPSPF